MRLAFVSDMHGNLAALESVIKDLRHRGLDQVVNLGDSLSGPLLPEETALRLRELPWLHVAGKHERQWLTLPRSQQNASDRYSSARLNVESRPWLSSHVDSCDPRLHEARLWSDGLGEDVARCHGSPRSDLDYRLETPDGAHVRLAIASDVQERSMAAFQRAFAFWPAVTTMCRARSGSETVC